MSINIASICVTVWFSGYCIASTRRLIWACHFALFRVGIIFEISIDATGLIRHIASIWSAPSFANVGKICNTNHKIKSNLVDMETSSLYMWTPFPQQLKEITWFTTTAVISSLIKCSISTISMDWTKVLAHSVWIDSHSSVTTSTSSTGFTSFRTFYFRYDLDSLFVTV